MYLSRCLAQPPRWWRRGILETKPNIFPGCTTGYLARFQQKTISPLSGGLSRDAAWRGAARWELRKCGPFQNYLKFQRCANAPFMRLHKLGLHSRVPLPHSRLNPFSFGLKGGSEHRRKSSRNGKGTQYVPFLFPCFRSLNCSNVQFNRDKFNTVLFGSVPKMPAVSLKSSRRNGNSKLFPGPNRFPLPPASSKAPSSPTPLHMGLGGARRRTLGVFFI